MIPSYIFLNKQSRHPDMKILIYINSLRSGGAERFTSYLASFLVSCGDEVLVISKTDAHDFYALDPSVGRMRLALPLEHTVFRGLFLKTRSVLALRSIMKSEKADILLGIQTTNSVISVMACMGLATKVVVCERNYPGRKRVSVAYAILRRLQYRYADLQIAQTERAARWLKRNTKGRHIKVIPNAVTWPLPSCEPVVRPEDALDADKKVLLAAGDLGKWHQKGFDILLSAFADVAKDFPDWCLVILGRLDKPEYWASMLDADVSTIMHRLHKLRQKQERIALRHENLSQSQMQEDVVWAKRIAELAGHNACVQGRQRAALVSRGYPHSQSATSHSLY